MCRGYEGLAFLFLSLRLVAMPRRRKRYPHDDPGLLGILTYFTCWLRSVSYSDYNQQDKALTLTDSRRC